MTPQTAAALRALVEYCNANSGPKDASYWARGYARAHMLIAEKLAAVLTQEGACKHMHIRSDTSGHSECANCGEVLSRAPAESSDSTSATACICPLFNCPAHTYRAPNTTAAAAVPAGGEVEQAPKSNLPSWSECQLRVSNSEFFAKQVAEGGYGADEEDTLLANAIHQFIYEYDCTNKFKSQWWRHRLELMLNEVAAR